MSDLKSLEDTLCQAVPLMRRAVEQSASLQRQGHEQQVVELWEEFLGEFFHYAKSHGDSEGNSLLSRISMSRILSMGR